MPEAKDCVVVGGIPTSRLSRQALCGLVLSDRRDGENCRLMFDVNGQGLALAVRNKAYRHDLLGADVIHADGQPIVAASRLFTRTPIADRSCTTDMFIDIAAGAEENKSSIYLLGATETVNSECTKILRKWHPGLRIAGRRNGYFAADEEEAICDDINTSGADILWVGLGKPAEQAFCVRNKARLKCRWAITCGGCFNYIVGEYPRAPLWAQRAGLEWAHRMFTRPRLLAWRYLTTTPIALFLLLMRTKACNNSVSENP